MTPTTQFRNDAVFLSKPTHRALRLVAKAKELTCSDELANQIINDWLKTNHPDVCQHVADQHRAGEDFAKELHKKLKPERPRE